MITMPCVILFTDIHDFSIVQRHLGDRAGEFIQQVYERLGEEIVCSHGTIIKYLGDAIMAVFPDKAEAAAVRCAFSMRRGYAELVREWKLPGETELEVGIGSGKVVRATFGHPSRRCEDVFGEEVNCTAVISHHRGVAVTAAARERLKESFRTRRLPDQIVKWRPEPLEVWEVLPEHQGGA
jgi:two-component system sensor histidine kinase ChiS